MEVVATAPDAEVNGVPVWSGLLDPDAQAALIGEVREVVRAAPLVRYRTRRGPMSVRMTAAGEVGWGVASGRYGYAARHPNGTAWPPIPPSALAVWRAVSGAGRDPDSCLVNFYDADARMGLHQDRDEAEPSWPVVSISLGDEALFRVGGVERPAPSRSVWLRSGDVAVLSGDRRLAHHGIDRIRAGSSTLLPQGGRINLTLRVAR